MRVIVKLLNEKGRRLNRVQFSAMAGHRGMLRVNEDRRQQLGRFAIYANLLSDVEATLPNMLPSLRDPMLLFVRDGTIRITGTEEINGTQYNQGWDMVVSSC